jgi:hypothetical protein
MSKKVIKQIGQNLILNLPNEESPITRRVVDKEERDHVKFKILDIIPELESTNNKNKIKALNNKIKALFENTEKKREEENKKTKLKSLSNKKNRISDLLTEMEKNKDTLSESDLNRLSKLIPKSKSYVSPRKRTGEY